MGIVANGKANYIRNINDAYNEIFSKRYLTEINKSIDDSESIIDYLHNQKIKGALIGISYIRNIFEKESIENKGYYSFYFFTDNKSKFNHGIVLEILSYKLDQDKKHIFQKKLPYNDYYITYYGLDYDQYLFQRASIALIETNSEIFEKGEITLKSILNLDYNFTPQDKIPANQTLDSVLIELSKDYCCFICRYLNLSIGNIFDIISDKNIPRGKKIVSQKILNSLN